MQAAFCDGTMAEECTRQTVVLNPKGISSDFRGIGLVEVIWKTMYILLNCRFTAAITFHDVLNGFRAGRGTGTVALDSKLLQRLRT